MYRTVTEEFEMPSTRRSAALLGGPALAILMATAVVAGPASPNRAQGTFVDVSGAEIGWVKLVGDGGGIVHVNVKVDGLTPGLHGIHIHAVGSCSSVTAAFDGAGGHYNPLTREHGLDNPDGPHAGDLPNLVVDVEGRGSLNAKTDRVTLSATSVFDADGTAFIIHANPDNQTNTPVNGGSGPRIACAVVVAN
jgi:Cu-Zn family superoxide dismutase